ncbi:hypothetical protein MANY_23400 [Mycolicibacterium anyangense]|uniref:Siderophore export accessory protein MmpS4 n=1 Tax=Mycolicibacterium anyangense TaxID=1431246 RepID=A0A6N4W9H2_9MYCO|nr:hypothetical protein MANY_23400 [Mycolicibacterium anyangense]
MDAVVEGELPDVEPPHSEITATGAADASKVASSSRKFGRRGRESLTPPATDGSSARKRRPASSRIFGLLRRLWIPLVVLAVVVAGGFTVSRLHGIFGSQKPVAYGDTRTDTAKPINPKYLKYEVWGAPGTVAQISYFNENGDPQFIQGVSLPWTFSFPMVGAAGIGSVAAQGDTDTIGCRITVGDEVKTEKVTNHEVSSFVSCMLKAA